MLVHGEGPNKPINDRTSNFSIRGHLLECGNQDVNKMVWVECVTKIKEFPNPEFVL